uniref:FXNA-like protease n=1 Tax=Hadrurus spadix TaxID=141984 RepID=A0A1W7RAI7_9SCOR
MHMVPSRLLYVLTALWTTLCNGRRLEPTSPYFYRGGGNESDLRVQKKFNEKRVRTFLNSVVGYGDRVTGSDNEQKVSLYILKQLIHIKSRSTPYNVVEVQLQRASGSFSMPLGDGMTVNYRTVTNLLARIGPLHSPSLLISCHYDTVPNSPGAVSSAFHCAVMMELFFVMSQYEWPLNNSIIFLFSGATEFGHQAAHGFTSKHPWSKNVTAFLNLDAIGTDGRIMAIEAGPENPWMIESYAYSAKFPLASIIAQELLRSDAFWVHTDHQVFSDIGKWPGLDLAYVGKGYIHRTKYDVASRISSKMVITAGKNLLAVILKLLKSPYMLYPIPFRKTKLVYFDVLGIFLVSYSIELGTVMNEIISLLTMVEIGVKLKLESTPGISFGDYVIDIIMGMLVSAFSCLFATGWNAGLGALIEIAGHSMAWYTRTYWIFGLYVCPAIACLLTVHWIAAYLRRKRSKRDWLSEDKYYDSIRVLWIIITCALGRCNYQVVYVCITWVLFPTIIRSLLGRLLLDFQAVKESGENTRLLVLLHFCMQIVPLVITIYTCWIIYMLLIPNLGRAGSEVHPDVIMGITTALLTFACISYTLTLVQISHPCHIYLPWIIGSLATLNVITLLMVLLTKLGFPYSGDVDNPSPQIYTVVDVERTFRNLYGDVQKYDSGYWLIPYDKRGLQPLLEFSSQVDKVESVFCEDDLYCGMPFLLPFASRFRKTFYLKTDKPRELREQKKFELVSSLMIGYNVHRLTFKVTGSDHMSIILSPAQNVTIRSWSIANGEMRTGKWWKNRRTYFIYYVHDVFYHPWRFWIDVWAPFNFTEELKPVLDVAFVCHYLHGQSSESKPFMEFLQQLPDWIHHTSWRATYDRYVFSTVPTYLHSS